MDSIFSYSQNSYTLQLSQVTELLLCCQWRGLSIKNHFTGVLWLEVQVLSIPPGYIGRHGGLVVSALIPEVSSLGSSPGWGHGVVFLGKTLNSHGTSLHPGV